MEIKKLLIISVVTVIGLIGIFGSRERAEFARRKYITKHKGWTRLESSLKRYIKKVTRQLERGYLVGETSRKARENLALSDEDRANWWVEVSYKIREIELNAILDEMLYAE